MPKKGMAYFAHSSRSIDDPDIIHLMDKFGDTGYYIFFGLIELMSQEFDFSKPAEYLFAPKFLERRLNKPFKILRPVLEEINKLKRMDIIIDEKAGEVHLVCPKLKELTSNYVKRVLAGTQWRYQKKDKKDNIGGQLAGNSQPVDGDPISIYNTIDNTIVNKGGVGGSFVDSMVKDLFDSYRGITAPKSWCRDDITNFVKRNKDKPDIMAKARKEFSNAKNSGQSAKDIILLIEGVKHGSKARNPDEGIISGSKAQIAELDRKLGL